MSPSYFTARICLLTSNHSNLFEGNPFFPHHCQVCVGEIYRLFFTGSPSSPLIFFYLIFFALTQNPSSFLISSSLSLVLSLFSTGDIFSTLQPPSLSLLCHLPPPPFSLCLLLSQRSRPVIGRVYE